MKNRTVNISGALLAASLGAYFFVVSDGSIRTVEFVSILAIGVLAGVFFTGLLKGEKRST